MGNFDVVFQDKEGGVSLSVRAPVWPPRRVEDLAAERIAEVREFFAKKHRGVSMSEVLPGLTLGVEAYPGKPTAYKVSSPGAIGTFASPESMNFEDAESAAKAAENAVRAYPAQVRAMAVELLRAGVDMQDLADSALAESVMEG